MGTTTPINGYPVPAGSDPNNIPADLAALVAILESGSPLKRLTQTQIDALTPAQKPNGLVVVNLTTGRVQMSDGAAFKNISGITINDDGSVVVKSVIVKDGAAEALRLWLNGGTAMVDSGVAGRPLRLTSGLTTIALTYGSGATLSPQTAPGDGPSNLVTKGYADTKLPLAGGALSGDLAMDVDAGDRAIVMRRAGVARWRLVYASDANVWAVQRRSAAGAYVDDPLLIDGATGRVVSGSHVGGVANVSGATSGTISLPVSPSGRWSVTLTGVAVSADALPLRITAVTANSVSWAAGNGSAVASVHWHAIAY